MKQLFFSKLSALSGVVAAATVLIVVVIAGSAEPGYSHKQDMISELNAQGTHYAALTGYGGFISIGLVTLLFLWRFKDEIELSRKSIVGLFFVATIGGDWLITALLPCDAGCPVSGDISLSQKIHLLYGFLTTFFMPIGVYLLIGSLRQEKFSQAIVALAFAVIGVNVLVFALMVSSMFNDSLGLLQRINVGFFYGFLTLLSFETYRRVDGNR